MKSAPLAHLKFPVEQGRGRRYPNFRILTEIRFSATATAWSHSRAFRRLENKTQVFATGLSDHFRNRLTHTIEVSQIARTVAGVLGLDEDLTEALALAHDIGHPPFGACGRAGTGSPDAPLRPGIRSQPSRAAHCGVLRESLARFPGLNLTFEVREGVVKHSRDFEPGEFPELDEYLPGLKPPLEAQLIDLCDEIAYDTSDLDDGYHAGLVSAAAAGSAVDKFRELDETMSMQFPGAPDRVRMHELVRALVDSLVSGLIQGTVAAASSLKDVEAVRASSVRVAQYTPEAAAAAAQLKRYLRAEVYESDRLVEGRNRSTEQIRSLFEYYLDHPENMPANYLEESAGEPLHRQVCDYIAGMTDGFVERTCAQLGICD